MAASGYTLTNHPKSITNKFGLTNGDLIDGHIPMIGELDEINMNSLYLRLIFDEMVAFVNASHRKDLNSMYDSLTMMDALISPKIYNTGYEIKLRWVEANIDKAIIRDENGTPVFYRPALMGAVKKQIYIIFKIMLKLIDQQGMLTFTKQSPGKVMSKFRSA